MTIPADRREDLRDLFGDALEATREERERVLLDRATRDPALVQEVRSLLAAHDSAGDRFVRPAIAALAGAGANLPGPAASLEGKRIGPYTVLRKIGEGGMGAVYEATRDDAIRHRVAIKTIGRGADSATIVARFHHERRILAALQHPNIATLFDAGVTEDGTPYFVMEYVDGASISAWCAEHRLTIRERLDLFRQACGAVQYAHRNLVVHRDLKPANILVSRDGVVKLLDFGIAKLVRSDEASGDQAVTGVGLAAMTTVYASPEQARGEVVTTATDVYSLGVVLYRLLAGRTPFLPEGRTPAQLLAAVMGESPTAPSAACTGDAAESCGLPDQAQLARALDGELDAIVLMALRKEPARRYPTVEALSDDVLRYLKGLPVSARPDTRRYRLRKFIARRRALVAGIGVACLSLVGGTAVSLREARAAHAEARKATRIADFLQEILGAPVASVASVRRLPQATLTVAEMLDTAAAHLPEELHDDPSTRALLHRVISSAFYSSGRFAASSAQADSALAIHQRLLAPDDPEIANDLVALGLPMLAMHPDSAASLARRARSLYEEQGGPDTLSMYEAALWMIGTADAYRGRLASAESTYTSLLDIERHRAKPHPETLGFMYGMLGRTYHDEGKLDSAESYMRHGIALYDSSGTGPSLEEATQLYTFGTHLVSRGRFSDAIPVLQRARDMGRAATPRQHPLHLQAEMALADALSAMGDTAEARREATRALALIDSLPAGSGLYAFIAEWTWAKVLRREGLLGEAESMARRQYATGMTSARDFPYYLSDSYYMLGVVLSDRGKYAEAERALISSYETARDGLGASNMRTERGQRELALLYLRWGRPRDAGHYLAMLTVPAADSIRQRYSRERRSRQE